MQAGLVVGVMVAAIGAAASAHADAVKLERASFDFRIARLDPKAIGTRGLCDVELFEDAGTQNSSSARDIKLRCANRGHGSSIVVALPPGVMIPRAVDEWRGYTQIEVEIDGPSPDADAHTKLVRIVGTTADPRPSKCLCRADREPKEKAPEGFDFRQVQTHEGLNKYWGKNELCVVTNVLRIGRSRGGTQSYAIEDAFDAEQLPYYAEVYCASKTGSGPVLVGARTPYQILALRTGIAVDIELGWVKRYAGRPTGRLGGTRYQPRER